MGKESEIMNAKLIQVIVTDLDLRGNGTTEDPIRRVIQYWSVDGKLLAENDQYQTKLYFEKEK